MKPSKPMPAEVIFSSVSVQCNIKVEEEIWIRRRSRRMCSNGQQTCCTGGTSYSVVVNIARGSTRSWAAWRGRDVVSSLPIILHLCLFLHLRFRPCNRHFRRASWGDFGSGQRRRDTCKQQKTPYWMLVRSPGDAEDISDGLPRPVGMIDKTNQGIGSVRNEWMDENRKK